jgi:hypothetical protein
MSFVLEGITSHRMWIFCMRLWKIAVRLGKSERACWEVVVKPGDVSGGLQEPRMK